MVAIKHITSQLTATAKSASRYFKRWGCRKTLKTSIFSVKKCLYWI